MRITDLEYREKDNMAGIYAHVHWEDCDQPGREIFIETTTTYAGDVALDPHAFLVGCLIPAMHLGEGRIVIDGQICPYLFEGLETVVGLMRLWSDGAYAPIHIEATEGFLNRTAEAPGRAGMLLSGGMDSLAALRLNRLRYGKDHPGAVRDCFLIHGFDIGGVVERGMKYQVFERAKTHMSLIAQDADVELIPVYTNIRHLWDDRNLWLDKFFGAVLAAVAHGFSSRLNLLYIASSYDLPHLHPCGSHPMLDPEFSSYGLRIRHRDVALSRLEKLRIVAEWEVAFQNFRVCLANVPDRLNCGRCEKCVRTMAGLAALGLLDKTRAFQQDDLTPDHFSSFSITIRTREPFYRELIPHLKERGREDLAETIARKLSE
ncbi:hypothetical protein D3OALGB2SA_380 [Olavius algarvensis associated proteobacterium Delta 3]|nr:hypothetical protein D3OALGB2SA_380 [Olavius algarvensis associated proteobacterium Delta 3]